MSTAAPELTAAEELRQAAALIRERAGAFHAAAADLLEEIARQCDAPPCDDPSGVCTPCEWRPDFNDALRVARAFLDEGNE
jgi:hypothetical protein